MAPVAQNVEISLSDDDSIEKKQKTKIYLLDGTFKEISYDRATTVADAIKDFAQKIDLVSYASFGLFECSRRARHAKKDEFFGLKDDKFIQEIVEEFESMDQKCRLLFKRKLFYETDEAITEEAFRKLLYLQFTHDFLEGFYPFNQKDLDYLAKLSALLLLANIGSIGSTHYNKRNKCEWNTSYVEKYRPKYLRRGDKNRLNDKITDCYHSMKDNMEKEEAEYMFVTMLRNLRYGNSVFFIANWSVFPTKDLKIRDSIVLAINSFGVHFIKRDPSTCLHSVQLKDVKQFGIYEDKLVFNMLVEGAMHEFSFETKQAEEIIVALKTHMQDQMNCRGTKSSSADSDVSPPPDASVCDLNQEQDSLEEKEADIKVKELESELQRCVDVIVSYVAVSDEWAKETSALEETCSSQRDEISVLQHQLAAANQKLKMADLREADLQDRLREAENQLLEGEKLRKKLHNTILELKGNIRVFCRVRPLLPDDGPGAEPTVSYPTSAELAGRGIDLIQSGQKYPFTFDKVFAHDASQQEVFMEISQLVQSALDGYKVCIFAYGQTGSGKTYTMMGRPEAPLQKGLIPRSLEQVFQTSQALAAQGWKYKMQASMLEIYNENIQDLLASKSNTGKEGGKQQHQYKISHDAEGNATVADLTIVDVSTIGQVSNLLQKAAHSRSVGRTDMNEESSRSHFVFTLRIYGVNESTEQVQGVLNLIDLAGSERLSRSGATGERLKETQAINKSLSSLSAVILALAKKDDHVPFRNSKLTYLLQPCLSGDSKTLMFVNVSPDPSSIGESLCSLRFAARVNSCEIGIPRRQAVRP